MEEIVHDYMLKVQSKKPFTFGIEIEFAAAALEKVSDNLFWAIPDEYPEWEVKPDGSCSDYKTKYIDGIPYDFILGGEVVSPICTNTTNDWEVIKYVCEVIDETGGMINGSCAGHIHFGANILDSKFSSYRNLIMIWLAFEDVIASFASGEQKKLRCNYKTHMFLLNGIVDPDLLMIDDSRTVIELLSDAGLLKVDGVALEFDNLSFEVDEIVGTIEVKIPNGTLSPVIWQNNVQFFVALLEKASTLKTEELEIIYKVIKDNKEDYPEYGVKDKFKILIDILFENELIKHRLLQQFLCDDDRIVSDYTDFNNSLEQSARIRV